MIKSKKAFTLVELLAVIVVLVIISILAIAKISDVMRSNNEKTVIANASVFLKAINDKANLSRLGEGLEDGSYTVAELFNNGINISGTKPDSGSVYVYDGRVINGCFKYGKYYYQKNILSNEEIISKNNICSDNNFELETEFDYKGSEEIYTAFVNGWYRIDAWGAQGGHINDIYYGGFGGYSSAYIHLNKGDKLYINVGGKGVINGDGGYNGGGLSNRFNSGSGGGATSIAKKSGLLYTLETSKDDIVIVAGGGGGAKYYTDTTNYASTQNYSGSGGSGGGYIGGSGIASTSTVYGVGLGGTQTEGGWVSNNANGRNRGLFGKGVSPDGYTGAGSGAGYYGGGTIEHGPAGGGSGYIGYQGLVNAVMYCYDCSESTSSNTKTVSTDCTEEDATVNCAKKENGYVKISYDIDNTVSANSQN